MRRLWDTKAPPARETDGDGAPSLPFFRNSMHRGHCFFAIRLCSAKEGGHGRPGRVEIGLLFSHHAHWNQAADRSTQAVPPDQRDALCPSTKIQKQAALLVLVGIWDDFRHPLFDVGGAPFLYEVLVEE